MTKSELVHKINEAIRQRFEKESRIVSVTPVGSSTQKINPSSEITDLDFILVFNKLEENIPKLWDFGAELKERFETPDTGIEIGIAGGSLGRGPFKKRSNKPRTILLDFRAYDEQGYRNYKSPLTRFSWQEYLPLVGRPLREISAIEKITFADLFNERDGFQALKEWVETGIIGKRKSADGTLHKPDNSELLEVYLYSSLSLATNMVRAAGQSVCFAGEDAVTQFEQLYPISSKNTPRYALMLKEAIRNGKDHHALDEAALRNKTLDFIKESETYVRSLTAPFRSAVKYFIDNSACNMRCPFCFSDWAKYEYTDTATIKDQIFILRSAGINSISFSGGEPLLRKDLPELLKFAKEQGMKTSLVTNGIGLAEKISMYAPHLDNIGIALDSAQENIQNMLRPTKAVDNYYKSTLALIELICQRHIPLSINTIATQMNQDSIIPIGKLIQGKAKYWVINQFRASGSGQSTADKFSIDDDTFTSIVEKCRNAYPTIRIYSFDNKRDTGCRIITPKGDIIRTTNHGLEDLGLLSSLTKDQIANINQPKEYE